MVFEKCRDILLKESELVERIASLQDLVWEAVVNRNWIGFEGYFDALGDIGEEFSVIEAERERFFAEIYPESEASWGFYAYAAQLPVEDRDELTEIYRNLKLKTLRVQMNGDSLMGYIAGMRATMEGFFEIAFPDRGGKLYTPHGIPASHDMRSIVLNQCF